MAYGTKYRFTFESTNGATYRILIQKDGYSGSILDRCLGRAPVLKRKRSGRVHGTSMEIYAECKVDGEFSELYTSSATEFRVQLYKENTLKWSGFVSPELYSEPDIAPPYDVQIVATDGLGELKLHTFEPQGSKTLSALFAYLLLFTGRSIGRAYKTELSGLDSSGNAVSVSDLLGTATIDIDYMAGENCYDVLQYLLATLCASITYYNTSWMIWRDNDATASNMGYQSVTNMGGGGLWPVGNLSTKIEPAKNQVTVEAPFHVWSPLVNPDMDSDSGWSKNSYVTYDATRQGYKFYCPESFSSADEVVGKLSQSVANLTILQDLILSFSLGNVFTDGELDVNISFSVNGLVNLNLYWDYNNNVLVWATSAPSGATRMYYNPADGGETITIPKIPSTLSAYQVAGTLKIEFSYMPRVYSFGQFGYEFYIYSAFLTRSISKGYRDILKIDNSARGEGETVEIAQGRLLANMVGPYYSYLRGVFCLTGKFVTGFKDSNFTSYSDFLALTARNYARLVALPRLRITGTLDTPASLSEPPMILRKGAVDYLLETCSWDLLNDELEIDALSLPSATLQVDSETVIDTTGESASSGGSSSGGGGGGGGGGTGTVTGVKINDNAGSIDSDGVVDLGTGFVKTSGTAGLLKNDGTVDPTAYKSVNSLKSKGNVGLPVFFDSDGNAQNINHLNLHADDGNSVILPYILNTFAYLDKRKTDPVSVDGGSFSANHIQYLFDCSESTARLTPSSNEITIVVTPDNSYNYCKLYIDFQNPNALASAGATVRMDYSTAASGNSWTLGTVQEIISGVHLYKQSFGTSGVKRHRVVISGIHDVSYIDISEIGLQRLGLSEAGIMLRGDDSVLWRNLRPHNSTDYSLGDADHKWYDLFVVNGHIFGNLRLKGSGNFGNKINFGDGEYVYIGELSDDVLTIFASGGIDLRKDTATRIYWDATNNRWTVLGNIYFEDDVIGLPEDLSIATPQVTIGSRWEPISGGGAKFGTYLYVRHPKLGTAGYEWILMRRSKRGRKKSATSAPHFDIRRSGWSEAIGQGDDEDSYNWDPLTGTTNYVDLDTLRDFIMRRFVCTYDWQLSNWRNSAYLLDILKDPRAIDPDDRNYTELRFGQTFPMGSGGSHSVTREKWRIMTRTIAQFGIAIRRVNPEFLEHYNPQQSLAKTTRQISYLDGSVRKTVDRYLYSEVVPLRCFINIGELAGYNYKTWHLSFKLQDI